jgi:hypothetical protein
MSSSSTRTMQSTVAPCLVAMLAAALLTLVVGQAQHACPPGVEIPAGATVERSPGYFCDDASVYCGKSWDGYPMACEAGVCAEDADGAAGTVCAGAADCRGGLVCAAATDGVNRCLTQRAAGEQCQQVSFNGVPPLVIFDRCPEAPYFCNLNTLTCEVKIEKAVGETCAAGWDCVGWGDGSVQCELAGTGLPQFRAPGETRCYEQVGLGEACGQQVFKNCPYKLDDGTNVECVGGVCVKFDKARIEDECGPGKLECAEGLSCRNLFGFQECVSFSLEEGSKCEPNSPLVREGGLTSAAFYCQEGLACVAVPCPGGGNGCRGQEGFCRAIVRQR